MGHPALDLDRQVYLCQGKIWATQPSKLGDRVSTNHSAAQNHSQRWQVVTVTPFTCVAKGVPIETIYLAHVHLEAASPPRPWTADELKAYSPTQSLYVALSDFGLPALAFGYMMQGEAPDALYDYEPTGQGTAILFKHLLTLLRQRQISQIAG